MGAARLRRMYDKLEANSSSPKDYPSNNRSRYSISQKVGKLYGSTSFLIDRRYLLVDCEFDESK